MGARLERLFRTESSARLSSLVLLADGLLSISSEYGCEASADFAEGEALVYYSGCSLGQDLFELEELIESGVTVRFTRGTGGIPPRRLLESASRYALGVLAELKGYAQATSGSGVEYSLFVMRSGDVYIAEGEVGRVSLPYVGGVVLEAHTHPSFCLPSDRDAATAMVRFMEGLFASAVVGPTCMVMAYRVGPLAEEDLVTLRRLPTLLAELGMRTGVMDLGNIRVLVAPY